jgi:HSP20 family protein
MEEEFGRLWDRLLPDEGWLSRFEMGGFTPAINVSESANAYEVTADMPGMKPEDLTVELKDGALWISGKKEEEMEEEGKTFHRMERRYGEFRRVIPMPGTMDESKIDAEYHDGVLKIMIPKTEQAKAKRIEIHS